MLHPKLPEFIAANYVCCEWYNASAVMREDHPTEWQDLLDILSEYRLNESYITNPGKNKSKTSIFIDQFLGERGWKETKFDTKMIVDGVESEAPTHKIDMFRNKVALEIEWNNKDPFYDRDLNNFRLLHSLRAVSVGIIITRSDQLQEIFNDLGRVKSYGNSTTHLSKCLIQN